MGAIVTNNIRVFNANQFINAFQASSVEQWVSGQSYVIGDVVQNSKRKYVATTAGTAGGTAPTHTSGVSGDGGVDWLFVESFSSSAYFNNSLYLCVGKNTAWYDFTGVSTWTSAGTYEEGDLVESTVTADTYYEAVTDHTGETNDPENDSTNWRLVDVDTPAIPKNNYTRAYPVISDIISGKKVQSTDVSLAVRRYNWTSGTVYSMFDADVEGFAYPANNPFYVYNSEGNLYKCLDNNNDSQSTSEPTGATDYVNTVDGYTWKYMASVSPTLAVTDYVPVVLKTSDDGSSQWNTQENANEFEIGAIKVTAGGEYSGTPTVVITPDPADTITVTATATAIMNGSAIDYIQVTNHGSGYVNPPTITFTGVTETSAADTQVFLSPKEGNGKNVVTELDARYALIGITLNEDESGYFPIDSSDNVFRQITLLSDPKDASDDSVCTATTFIGPVNEDWDGSQTSGLREFKKGSGKLLYIENIAPVTRASGQTEDIKIVLKF